MRELIRDVRFGLRILRKNPGFAAVAIVTLALGIGANTAMFSVVYGVLLRPLPYPHPQQIVEIAATYLGQLDQANFDASQFKFWKEHRAPFRALAASTEVGFNLAGAGRPARVRALRVSEEYFQVLGVRPVVGGEFTAGENRAGAPNIAIISNGLWKRQFGADRGIIGRTVRLDGAPYAIIGVMPAGFAGLPPVDVWTTIAPVDQSIGAGTNYNVIARLKPRVSPQTADSYLSTLTQPFLEQFDPKLPERVRNGLRLGVFPYRYVISSDLRAPLLVLFGAIGLVLIIACANVANLLLGRAASRTREIAVRTALGASRLRVARQLLAESVLLAALGGALGLLVAHWGLEALISLAPPELIHAQQIALDRWALGFTALVTVLTGILFGLAPSLRASQGAFSDALKEGAGRASAGRRRQRLSGAMVVGEVALSLVLLAGCGLLIETFANLLRANPGFDPRAVLSLQIWTTGSKYKSTPALSNFYESLIHRIERIPGVRSAAVVAAGLPLERGGNVGVKVEGLRGPQRGWADYREITPDYFATLGVPLLTGRLFTAADSAAAQPVALVNAAFAHMSFPRGTPIGRYLDLEGGEGREVVGVVGDVRSALNEPAPPTIFIPVAQASYATDALFQGWFPTCIVVRTAGYPLELSHAVESAVREAAPDIPIGRIRSMEQVLSASLAFQRFATTLMSIFAGLALVLAGVGVYGVISFSVSQRTHEVGIRMALGARKRDVLRLVMGQGLILALAGVAIGIGAALGLTRFLASLLYGVKPTDPLTIGVVALILMAVALFASYIPARRAAKVDPMTALRYD